MHACQSPTRFFKPQEVWHKVNDLQQHSYKGLLFNLIVYTQSWQAMASGVLRPVLSLLLLLSLLLRPFQYGHGFAKLKQESPAAIRERSGNALRKRAGNLGNIKLDREERSLLGRISNAGERREWGAARSAFASYTGDAAPIYSAALHAAVRCRRYQEGAKIFELCQKRCKNTHAPVYTQALRIFGKLKDPAKVEDVWAESLEKCEFDLVLAAAGVAAAADLGNITGAAHILDMVNESALVAISEVFTLHFPRQLC